MDKAIDRNYTNELTNEITDDIMARMTPMAALIAYRVEKKSGRDGYFVEVRHIGEDGRMGEGMPVTYELMNEIALNYSEANSSTPYGAPPPGLLYSDTRKGSERYVWYNPPRRRMMYFSEGLGIPNDEYNVPGIIYVAGGDKLKVFAFGGQKPDPDGELFNAPYFNVSNPSGNVCLGTSSIRKPTAPTYGQLLEYWEKRFWKTEFTHLGGGVNPTKGNLVLVTKQARDKPFDYSQLQKSGVKLKELMK